LKIDFRGSAWLLIYLYRYLCYNIYHFQVIIKELKSAKEQLDSCPAERAELRAQYQARHDIIAEYAPSMMSNEEVEAYMQENFAEVLKTKNKGQIMKAVMGALKGKAEGKVINEVVAKLCM